MEDLKVIKKKFGEDMMRLCRKLFPSLLEEKGLLSHIMLSSFYPNHDLYTDLVNNHLLKDFASFINNKAQKTNILIPKANKTPQELLKEAGYSLFECKSQEDILKFKKFYDPKEVLCTFEEERLKTHYVFFAFKEDFQKLKRKDFKNPTREDEYGSSLISIQFSKDNNHFLSIKSRYNHAVYNGDAAFSNNLDNIIPGLTDAFAKDYGMVQKNLHTTFSIPGYCMSGNYKFYKYNYRINNIYYCTDNIIVDHYIAHQYDKEKYLVFDYFILDLVSKKLLLYDSYINDALSLILFNIDKIDIIKKKEEKEVIITLPYGMIVLTLNKENQIIKYYQDFAEYIGDYFLFYNNSLQNIILPTIKSVGECFMYMNTTLKSFDMPNLSSYRKGFFYNLFVPKLSKKNFNETYITRTLRRVEK